MTASIYELMLALGRSVCTDTERQRQAAQSLAPHALLHTVASSPLYPHPPPPTSQQLLRRAYAVLLQGPPANTSGRDDTDIAEELQFVQFEMACSDAERSAQLGQCLAKLPPIDGRTDAAAERDVLEFLLHLRESVQPRRPAPTASKIFGMLHLNGGPRQPFNCYTNVLNQYSGKNEPVSDANPTHSFFDIRQMDRRYAKSLSVKTPKAIAAPPVPTVKPILPLLPVVVPVARAESAIHLKGQSWDYVNVPLDRHQREHQFATESAHSLPHMLHQIAATSDAAVPVRMLSTRALIADLKYLLCGTPSESFAFDEDSIRFEQVAGVSLAHGTAATTRSQCAEFVECGTCCARLRLMCDRDVEFGPKFEGFVFRTVCLSVEDFLDVFQVFVEGFADASVLQLTNRVAPLMRQIQQLAIIFDIHPYVTPDASRPPMPLQHGAAFLDSLHRECTHYTQPDVALMFTHILQQCCRVYYSHLELWLFHGRIEDAAGELFVEVHDCQFPRTKYCWDNAFRVRTAAVPAFLLGTEQATLLCGKYTMLLKEIRAEHPLLREQPPRLTVCLSEGELRTLERECRRYGGRIQEVCGAPVTVREVYARQAAKRRDYVRRATERFAENMARWRAEQEQRVRGVREVHARQRAALERQIEEMHERRVRERRENLELEREVLRYGERVEAERAERERAEREKCVEYYEELGQMVEKRRAEADAVVVDLRTQLAEAKTLTAKMETCLAKGSAVAAEETAPIDCNRNPVAKLVENETIVASPPETAPKVTVPMTPIAADANANPATEATAPQQAATNKATVLGTTFDFQHHSTAGRQATELLRTADAVPQQTDANSNPTETCNAAHMEMLQNRARVMGQEYDLIGHTSTGKAQTSTTALKDTVELTDLQRNRRKIMSEEFGLAHQLPATHFKAQMHLDLRTTEPIAMLTVPEGETPMSTSSDTPSKRLEDGVVAVVPLKLDISSAVPVTGTPIKTPEMQTAVACLGDEPFRFAASASVTSSVYETARSGHDEAFDFSRPATSATAPPSSRQTARFEYPQSQHVSRISSNAFFALPALGLTPPAEQPPAQNDTEASAEVDSLADSSTITSRLRHSYLLPLRTHLRVLSNEVLKVFLLDLHVLQHFKSLRNYFFMMDGEFASHIADGLFGKLHAGRAQPAEILNFACLHTLLDSARESSINNDPNADRLSFIIDDIPERFDLWSPHVLRMLSLTYDVEWPLNLLLSPEAIVHYARIFQHLLALRRCRYVLDESSQLLKDVAKRSGPGCLRSAQYRRVQQVRNKLLQFVNALQNHVTSTALQASWRRFKQALVGAETLEDCYQQHARYLKQVEFLCMLNRSSAKFYQVLESVMVLTLRFYRKLKQHNWQFDAASGYYKHDGYERLLTIETDFDKIVPYLIHMGEKMSRRGYQTEIEDLINLINFNGYYKADVRK